MEKNDLGIEIMFHTILWRHRTTSEKKKTFKKEFNSINLFEVIMDIQSYDHLVWFGSQRVYMGWTPLETSKVGENHVKTKVVLKKFLFGRIFGSGTFSILSIILFQLKWLVESQLFPGSGVLELKHKPSVLPWDSYRLNSGMKSLQFASYRVPNTFRGVVVWFRSTKWRNMI